jgi:hypothetical protein
MDARGHQAGRGPGICENRLMVGTVGRGVADTSDFRYRKSACATIRAAKLFLRRR